MLLLQVKADEHFRDEALGSRAVHQHLALRGCAAGGDLPRTWALQEGALKDAPVMALPLADLERFDGAHSGRLGSHARNIKAVAPEVGLSRHPPSQLQSLSLDAQPPLFSTLWVPS